MTVQEESSVITQAKRVGRWMIRFVGPLILGVLIVTLKVDLRKIQALLLSIRVEFFLVALFMVSPLSVLVRAWRWNVLLQIYGINYKLWEALKLFYIGLFVGSFVPQGLGTFSKALYLKADGYPLTRSAASILVDKGLNFMALALIGAASFSYLVLASTTIWRALALGVLIAALWTFMIKFRRKLGKLAKRILTSLFERVSRLVKTDMSWLYKDFHRLDRDRVMALILMSILAVSLDYLAYYLLTLALRLNIPFLYFVALSSVVAILQHIPVSFNGIGTREVTLILVFSALGESKESALALSTLILLLLLASNLLGGIAWMMRPLKLVPTST
jgi:uncharacterized protein (TIRG00374 family)